MINLKYIANDLGVSVATVSNAIRSTGRVSESVAARVLKRADELGYHPSVAARALKTGRSGILGFVMPDITHPLFPKLAQGVELAADAIGYGVLIADARDDDAGQTLAITRLVQRGVDGIVIVPRRGTRISEISVPMAVINTPSDTMNTVSSNHSQGGALAAEALLGLGHRRFLLLGGNPRSDVQRDRIAGMELVLGSKARYTIFWADEVMPDIGQQVASGTTAVLTVSDLLALQVMSNAQQAGLRLPEYLSLIGFDDLPICTAVCPMLSTIVPDVFEISRRAVAYLECAIDGKSALPHPSTVDMQLLLRGSTGPAPATVLVPMTTHLTDDATNKEN